ncbi:SixA phosphatase family protein [Sphingomonas sp. ID0503]|uniref:SixA phosphatase family protein n=1 Tax=Sphingomonas sp. ID0503 TaxID=3399691 RepID=UPI003AFB533F
MKKLTLLRHAKSSWDDSVQRDFDRPLNGKGRKAGHAIGAFMAERGLSFDRVVASPATRVMETIAAVEGGLGAGLAPEFDKRAYLAAPDTLLDIIHEQPDAAESILLIGHNPGLEELVLLLVDGGGSMRDAVAAKYPTAALAEIAFDVAGWSDVAEGTGKLLTFTRPRDLDPALGPEDD